VFEPASLKVKYDKFGMTITATIKKILYNLNLDKIEGDIIEFD